LHDHNAEPAIKAGDGREVHAIPDHASGGERDRRGAAFIERDVDEVAALVADWAAKPGDLAGLERIESVLTILKRLGVGFDLWRSQNIFFSTGKALYATGAGSEDRGPIDEAEWVRAFTAVGELLRVGTESQNS
jgi:hypothetical protein